MSPPERAINIDFAALAIADEDFAKIYRANDGRIDFQDPESVQQLTKSILKRDFGLKIELPDDRLCPPVPVRYRYIRWLQDLIDTTSDGYTDTYDPDRTVVGIDIGTGASCIYPLLGCAARPSWKFGGTDIDDRSFEYAGKNVELNEMQSRIRLKKVDPEGPLLDLKTLGIGQADFVMCNPPFFVSKEEMLATHTEKKRSPSAICTGADVEMITEGGDLGFVTRLLEESEKLDERVQWYSSMLGKLSSAQAVVERLKGVGISNWAVTSLQAGNVTKRWAVAWSFGDLRPRNDVARGDASNKEILPFPTEFRIPTGDKGVQTITTKVNETMHGLDIQWAWDGTEESGMAIAKANVWSRSARRKRKREMDGRAIGSTKDKAEAEEEEEEEEEEETAPALSARVSVLGGGREVGVRWLQGREAVLFESFCGMLKRALI